MNPSDYQVAAARTLISDPEPLEGLGLMHVFNAIGLVGEAGELTDYIMENDTYIDLDKVAKELGDVFWYSAAFCTKMGLDMADMMPDGEVNSQDSMDVVLNAIYLTGRACSVADHVKKGVFHRHGVNDAIVIQGLKDVLRHAILICWNLGLDPEEIMDQNVEKLKKRYTAGFSYAESVARVDVRSE